MKKTIVAAVGALTLIGSLVAGGAAASAAPAADELQAEIEVIMQENPGGVQTAPNEVAWDAGEVTITLPMPGASPYAVGNCATGSYCAYSLANQGGAKLTFTTCGTTVSVTSIGSAKSLANARSSGKIVGKNSAGTSLLTVNAGGTANYASSNLTKVTCS